nr:MAG TPA: HDAC4 deacetylase 4 [Caudoviricetes sp.]
MASRHKRNPHSTRPWGSLILSVAKADSCSHFCYFNSLAAGWGDGENPHVCGEHDSQ